MPNEVLTRRALNRAMLERQLLLRRTEFPVLDAVERMVALNAQDSRPAYLALWARVAGFERDQLTTLLYDRSVVRSTVLRGTQFMVTARDFLEIRPLLQPVLDRVRKGGFGKATQGLDLVELASATWELLNGNQLTRPQLGKLLAERWPSYEPMALAWSAQYLVAMIHPPPSGTWGVTGATPFVLGESWLDSPLSTDLSPEPLIKRYFAGFGPGTVKDVQAWCGLTRLREPVEAMELRTYRDEHGQTLYDLPDATLPDPDTVAPVRFLAHFDNVLLAQHDRTRIMTDEQRKVVCIGALVKPTLLVDGVVRGTWTLSDGVVTVELFAPLSAGERAEVAEECARLLDFVAPDAAHDLRFVS